MADCIYEGDMEHGMANGRGTLTWSDGSNYCGNFKDGEIHGQGIMKYNSAREWYDGKFRSAEGDVFEGEWNNKYKHKGIYKYANGDIYDGDWLNGKKHGFGTYTFSTGIIEKGKWEKDVFKPRVDKRVSGSQKKALIESNKFQTEINDMADRLHKIGFDDKKSKSLAIDLVVEHKVSLRLLRLKYSLDYKFFTDTLKLSDNEIKILDRYYSTHQISAPPVKSNNTGDTNSANGDMEKLVDDHEQSSGKITRVNTTKSVKNKDTNLTGKNIHMVYSQGQYDGDFVNGKWSGQGFLKLNEGVTYRGAFKDGEYDGVGAYNWKNRDIYYGSFKAGVYHGKGCLITYTDPTKREEASTYWGDFMYGNYHGDGKLIYPNGDEYIGSWRSGKREGKGTMKYHSNGQEYSGDWENDDIKKSDESSNMQSPIVNDDISLDDKTNDDSDRNLLVTSKKVDIDDMVEVLLHKIGFSKLESQSYAKTFVILGISSEQKLQITHKNHRQDLIDNVKMRDIDLELLDYYFKPNTSVDEAVSGMSGKSRDFILRFVYGMLDGNEFPTHFKVELSNTCSNSKVNCFYTTYRLHFICDHRRVVVPCGPNGNGYDIIQYHKWVQIAKPWYNCVAGVLNLGLRMAGFPCSFPEINFVVHDYQDLINYDDTSSTPDGGIIKDLKVLLRNDLTGIDRNLDKYLIRKIDKSGRIVWIKKDQQTIADFDQNNK